jgi:hypothetical protein
MSQSAQNALNIFSLFLERDPPEVNFKEGYSCLKPFIISLFKPRILLCPFKGLDTIYPKFEHLANWSLLTAQFIPYKKSTSR